MIKAYKYRLKPTLHQQVLMERTFGCCRYVYNWALSTKIEAYKKDKTSLSYNDLAKQMTLLKKRPDHTWLNEVSAVALQQSLRCMDAAYKNFFRTKKGFPKFKSKHNSKQSFKAISGINFDFKTNRVQLPIIGSVRFYKNQIFDGKLGTVTVTKSPTGKYYISAIVDDGIDVPKLAVVKPETTIGIDVGLKDFAVLSNGDVYKNPKYLEKSAKRLACLQRRLARKQKGSNRRQRAKLAVNKCYEKITNQRNDFLHKVSKQIVSENQTIIVEDLNVEGMLKNHHLARGIASASWSEFFGMLEYKSKQKGVNLIKIGRFEPSSKTCLCGHINHDLTLKYRTWTCPVCGSANDRDLLAATNIKRFGLRDYFLTHKDTSSVVYRVEDVELSPLGGALKRQNRRF